MTKQAAQKANRLMRRRSALMALLLLTGCASTTQFVHLPDQSQRLEDGEKGRLYVIRRSFSVNIASHTVPVTVNDGPTQIGYTTGRGYLCWERDPGEASISSSAYHCRSLEVSVEKGQVYYILQHVGPAWETVGIPGSGELTATMELVNEEKGRKELAQCKPPKSGK